MWVNTYIFFQLFQFIMLKKKLFQFIYPKNYFISWFNIIIVIFVTHQPTSLLIVFSTYTPIDRSYSLLTRLLIFRNKSRPRTLVKKHRFDLTPIAFYSHRIFFFSFHKLLFFFFGRGQRRGLTIPHYRCRNKFDSVRQYITSFKQF